MLTQVRWYICGKVGYYIYRMIILSPAPQRPAKAIALSILETWQLCKHYDVISNI